MMTETEGDALEVKYFCECKRKPDKSARRKFSCCAIASFGDTAAAGAYESAASAADSGGSGDACASNPNRMLCKRPSEALRAIVANYDSDARGIERISIRRMDRSGEHRMVAADLPLPSSSSSASSFNRPSQAGSASEFDIVPGSQDHPGNRVLLSPLAMGFAKSRIALGRGVVRLDTNPGFGGAVCLDPAVCGGPTAAPHPALRAPFSALADAVSAEDAAVAEEASLAFVVIDGPEEDSEREWRTLREFSRCGPSGATAAALGYACRVDPRPEVEGRLGSQESASSRAAAGDWRTLERRCWLEAPVASMAICAIPRSGARGPPQPHIPADDDGGGLARRRPGAGEMVCAAALVECGWASALVAAGYAPAYRSLDDRRAGLAVALLARWIGRYSHAVVKVSACLRDADQNFICELVQKSGACRLRGLNSVVTRPIGIEFKDAIEVQLAEAAETAVAAACGPRVDKMRAAAVKRATSELDSLFVSNSLGSACACILPISWRNLEGRDCDARGGMYEKIVSDYEGPIAPDLPGPPGRPSGDLGAPLAAAASDERLLLGSPPLAASESQMAKASSFAVYQYPEIPSAAECTSHQASADVVAAAPPLPPSSSSSSRPEDGGFSLQPSPFALSEAAAAAAAAAAPAIEQASPLCSTNSVQPLFSLGQQQQVVDASESFMSCGDGAVRITKQLASVSSSSSLSQVASSVPSMFSLDDPLCAQKIDFPIDLEGGGGRGRGGKRAHGAKDPSAAPAVHTWRARGDSLCSAGFDLVAPGKFSGRVASMLCDSMKNCTGAASTMSSSYVELMWMGDFTLCQARAKRRSAAAAYRRCAESTAAKPAGPAGPAGVAVTTPMDPYLPGAFFELDFGNCIEPCAVDFEKDCEGDKSKHPHVNGDMAGHFFAAIAPLSDEPSTRAFVASSVISGVFTERARMIAERSCAEGGIKAADVEALKYACDCASMLIASALPRVPIVEFSGIVDAATAAIVLMSPGITDEGADAATRKARVAVLRDIVAISPFGIGPAHAVRAYKRGVLYAVMLGVQAWFSNCANLRSRMQLGSFDAAPASMSFPRRPVKRRAIGRCSSPACGRYDAERIWREDASWRASHSPFPLAPLAFATKCARLAALGNNFYSAEHKANILSCAATIASRSASYWCSTPLAVAAFGETDMTESDSLRRIRAAPWARYFEEAFATIAEAAYVCSAEYPDIEVAVASKLSKFAMDGQTSNWCNEMYAAAYAARSGQQR
jgi:hypothetical protein